MSNKGWIAAVVVLVAAGMLAESADARRMGGGRSFGAQRQSIAPPTAAPRTPPAASTSAAPGAPAAPGAAANPVMPAQPSAAAARAGAPAAAGAAAAAPARSGMSRWLGPIAGLAAGLGLAALMSHLGLSEAFGTFLLLALLGVGVIFLVRMFMTRREQPPRMQYAASGATGDLRSGPAPAPASDANWGRPATVEPVLAGAAAAAVGNPRVPPGFDGDGFVRNARAQFTAVQAAWDAGDRRTLGDITTPEMFAEIRRDLDTRGAHQPTEVVRLDTDLLEVTTEDRHHWASVRFSGLLREDGAEARPFDETWNLSKPVDGSSGWVLAGIQQNEAADTVH
ncbi:MAG: Tim44-like domain-containing protein [Casimicrobiaceae bacterium]